MDHSDHLERILRTLSPARADVESAAAALDVLRSRLLSSEPTASRVAEVCLQGSLRRHTAIAPLEGEPLDVDIIVRTTLRRERTSPDEALRDFLPFFRDHYAGRWALRGRSIVVSLPRLRLKIVVAAAADPPRLREGRTEGAEAWGADLLYIPSRDASRWEPTNPQAQIAWTEAKNVRCNGHFVAVVRALKGWRRIDPLASAERRSYPLEHLAGYCCPDGIRGIDEGVTRTLESLVTTFEPTVMVGRSPNLASHGLPEKNVLARCRAENFADFISAAAKAARVARHALDAELPSESARLWAKFFSVNLHQIAQSQTGTTL